MLKITKYYDPASHAPYELYAYSKYLSVRCNEQRIDLSGCKNSKNKIFILHRVTHKQFESKASKQDIKITLHCLVVVLNKYKHTKT
jgi:hypothetical protein